MRSILVLPLQMQLAHRNVGAEETRSGGIQHAIDQHAFEVIDEAQNGAVSRQVSID